MTSAATLPDSASMTWMTDLSESTRTTLYLRSTTISWALAGGAIQAQRVAASKRTAKNRTGRLDMQRLPLEGNVPGPSGKASARVKPFPREKVVADRWSRLTSDDQ